MSSPPTSKRRDLGVARDQKKVGGVRVECHLSCSKDRHILAESDFTYYLGLRVTHLRVQIILQASP